MERSVVLCSAGQCRVMYEHVTYHVVNGPIEENGADLGGLAWDAPDNGAGFHIAFFVS